MHAGQIRFWGPYTVRKYYLILTPLTELRNVVAYSCQLSFQEYAPMDLLVDTHPGGHAFVPSSVLLLVASARRPTFRQPEFSLASKHGRAKGVLNEQ
jgi:hypothetical protein